MNIQQTIHHADMLLFDVEGTTTSKNFVYDILFPYSYDQMENFINIHQHEEKVFELLTALSIELNIEFSPIKIIKVLKEWIKEDRKHTLLKKMQGLIWKEGYQTGAIHGHVYPDVMKSFQRWKEWGKQISIYSSGSVLAQQLLFQNSVAGDLSNFISRYFDTEVGPKRHKDSYLNIAKILKLHPDKIVFFSDILEELQAAESAGMQAVLVNRDQTEYPTHSYVSVDSFSCC